MKVVHAVEKDMPGWLELAAEVEYLFGPMVEEPGFIRALEKHINARSAFCIREQDGPPGAQLLGGLLFSSTHAPVYKLGWLSVNAGARGRGVATTLVRHAFSGVVRPAEVAVVTFGPDIPDGQPARELYRKLGFRPSADKLPAGPEGGSRQKFILQLR
ncbi:Ribosomal protein S18 acetylase RimI [Paenibacillus sp. UNCCL117]|uniref:GNAT family N-acetyltransferase n=1 Tax=unclassified Paenibacillus TaxID=185978 RepID=UPI000887466F|nr:MULTISPECIES: GNAT family N-acetyltransferase [unclassified Paenibacillus]SDE18531.1 Ribosomal protein S18 acetylase RimI [Paenibacillus sp. cl123]SFW62193.1 Ribosomal protein S18 acetylase RimI [Paenibacillus sp. UNCCL117]